MDTVIAFSENECSKPSDSTQWSYSHQPSNLARLLRGRREVAHETIVEFSRDNTRQLALTPLLRRMHRVMTSETFICTQILRESIINHFMLKINTNGMFSLLLF